MTDSFPQWAPPELVEFYKDAIKPDKSNEDAKLIRRLMTSERMRTAWPEVEEQILKIANDETHIHLGPLEIVNFRIRIAYALLGLTLTRIHAQSESLFSLSRGEESKRFKEVADAAQALAKAIERLSLDALIYDFLPLDIIVGFISRANESEIEGLYCPLPEFLPTTLPKGSIFTTRNLYGEDSEFSSHKPYSIPFGNKKSEQALFEKLFPMQHPDVSFVARKIATEADKKSQEAMTRHRVIERPGNQSAKRVFVIRKIGTMFFKSFGMRLSGTTAAFSSVLLNDEDVSVENVNDAFRGYVIPDKGGLFDEPFQE